MENLKPKIIFFAPILEYPAAGGPQMSVLNAIKALHPISELHIVTTVPKERFKPDALQFISERCNQLSFAPSSHFNSNQSLLRKMRRVLAPILAYFDMKYTANYAAKNDIHIFWVDRVLEHSFSFFRQLRRQLPEALIVGDTCSVYSRFVLRELPLIKNPLRKWRIAYRGHRKEQQERELTATANVVTAVSDLDAEYFRSIAPNPNTIKLFSNVVDISDYTGTPAEQVKLHQPSVLLMGTYGHKNSPMDRAAQWLTDEIMPKVWSKLPGVHLYIVGKNSDKTLAHIQNDAVTVAGRVPSMLPYLQGTTATVVPLMYESGTRFKILESGAATVPCISTTLGAEGIEITDQENILIADDADAFASAIVSVAKDPTYARRLANNLHALIEKQYSIRTQQENGQNILDFLKKELSCKNLTL